MPRLGGHHPVSYLEDATQLEQTVSVLIRGRSDHDSAALEAIALETHRLDGYPKYLPADLRSFIVDHGALGAWVAEEAGGVVGHVALHGSSAPEVMNVLTAATGFDEGGMAVVARLLVAPGARGRGIGRALLEKATEEASRMGRRAVLDVVEEHTAAIRLYDSLGWSPVGRVEWSLPGDLLLREIVYVSPQAASVEFPT